MHLRAKSGLALGECQSLWSTIICVVIFFTSTNGRQNRCVRQRQAWHNTFSFGKAVVENTHLHRISH